MAALVLSVANYAQLNSEADVHLTMPKVLRISAPGGDGVQDVYLQPTFTATKRTERPAVLLDMTVLVEPQEGGEDMPHLPWHEVVDLTQPEAEFSTAFITRVSDPVPILVFGSEPVTPMAWFLPTEPIPALTVGKLQVTLLVEWQNKPDMVRDFCIDISQEAVDEFADPEQPNVHRFIKYPTSECYFFFA
ncbi:hypothetical protein [Geodermatophilus poikilotrophus]|uniref:Uncharacterized protein n=1 Tax=Geodermatophilus poikilotrophus TaxID=1333667 RepID=A0A1I0E7W6_9ACTN|nr:hypothetical protein [Geodermatophilus poikilotrophus]SET40509.1 hypothetical protein SAMN04488546_2365 [Geodermatophilus poikilotrophus]